MCDYDPRIIDRSLQLINNEIMLAEDHLLGGVDSGEISPNFGQGISVILNRARTTINHLKQTLTAYHQAIGTYRQADGLQTSQTSQTSRPSPNHPTNKAYREGYDDGHDDGYNAGYHDGVRDTRLNR